MDSLTQAANWATIVTTGVIVAGIIGGPIWWWWERRKRFQRFKKFEPNIGKLVDSYTSLTEKTTALYASDNASHEVKQAALIATMNNGIAIQIALTLVNLSNKYESAIYTPDWLKGLRLRSPVTKQEPS